MPRYQLEVFVPLFVEAVNEFDARHVALECWGLHRAEGLSQVGHWAAEPGNPMVTNLVEIAAPQRPDPKPAPRVSAPPPERRYYRPPAEPELGIF